MNTAMRIRRRRATALVSLGARVGAIVLILMALALLILSRTHPKFIEDIRNGADTVLAPVLILAEKPIVFIGAMSTDIESYLSVRAKNVALEQRLEDYQNIRRSLERLRAENRLLRDHLKVTQWPAKLLATGRVIGTGGGPFLRSVLIDAGSKAGVTTDAAAVDPFGVAGRTMNVGPMAARVLLLTDLNSRIPIRIERSGQTAILVGDNSNTPQIQFLPLTSGIALGDRVVTSGHGGVFPPDLPVGFVSFKDNGLIRVTPFADIARLNFLTVMTTSDRSLEPDDVGVSVQENEDLATQTVQP